MIKKLKTLLSETTILDFKFVLKLLRRYYWFGIFIPIIVGFLSVAIYKSQNEIYSAQITFSYVPNNNKGDATALSALVQNDKSGLTEGDVIAMVTSTSFLQSLSEDVYLDPDISKLNFNTIFSSNQNTFDDFTSYCKSEKCKIGFLRLNLSDFFTVQSDPFISDRYILNVKTLDAFTTTKVLKYVSNNILKYRLKTIKGQLTTQIKLTEDLIRSEEEEYARLGIDKVIKDKLQLDKKLTNTKTKLDLLSSLNNKKRLELEQLEISLKYTKSTINRKISSKDKKKWKKLENLREKRDDLMADISALETSMGEESSNDNIVIKQLQAELDDINRELSKVENTKAVGNLAKFQDSKLQSKDTVEFNINVLKDQLKSIGEKITELKEQEEQLTNAIKDKSNYLEENGASAGYIKVLKEKLTQIRLIKDTVVNDLLFDDFANATKRYKKYTLKRIIPFSLAITLFFTLIALIIRYIFDNRLMDEEEFKVLFDDIEFIGEIPEVEQT